MIASRLIAQGSGDLEGEDPWPAPRSAPILLATLVAGTLDILAAVGLTLYYGREPGGHAPLRRLRALSRRDRMGGRPAAALGLAVHFALMAAMVAIYVLAAARRPALRREAGAMGRPLRPRHLCRDEPDRRPPALRPPLPPPTRAIVTQLFCHIVLVGIPIALIAARYLRSEPFA